ncbi:hypothetical protein B0A50_08277 [Salinomyces thailandicus]|uniref:Mitochondrial import inner membrane translocase subunit TIM50 n=1 Tax=Salinomyces thailandicus TaxID=706561 RepID=A0A4U0TKZ0_9PEZI|nr:hypothetical protein B0A50_08277 [Salinomyces thailandica]
MLPRAARRAIRPSTLPSSLLHPLQRHSSPATCLSIRNYASDSGNRPRRPPPPSGARPAKPPPAQPLKAAPGSIKQTSPGTSIPRDQGKNQTWQPQDGIKFGAGAAMPAAANAQNAAEDAALKTRQTPVDGTWPADAGQSVRGDGVGAAAEEPQAQRIGADEPVPGSIRDQAQEKQAEAENLTPPPEPPSGAPAEEMREEAQQTGPLPDLRQGIPSTFDFEFGRQGARQPKTTRPSEQEEGVDVTTTLPGDEQREHKEREEREYTASDYETSLDKKRARMANFLYAGILSAIAGFGIYAARPFAFHEDVPPGLAPEDAQGWGPATMSRRVSARMAHQLGYYTEPTFPKLLPDVPESQRPPFTLVLSLEDLLIHSSWDRTHGYRTAKRPGLDYFIRYLSQYYELVLFTSVPLAMADPVIKKLDPYHFIMWPLGREATKYTSGEYVKDLSYLNRPLNKTLILDTHAPHVQNQPDNAIIIPKWSGDPKDPGINDLVALIPFLEYLATMGIDDVRPVLKSFEGTNIAQEFLRRENLAREKHQAQLAEQKSKSPRFSVGSLGSALGIKSSPAMGGGGLVLADGSSVGEGLAQGKMMSDLIREQGQKQYEHLERQIRENGAQWLKEEEEEQKKAMEASMKEMKKGALSWFGGGGKE